MFTGIFFKTLRGSNGWSRAKLSTVDVTLIKDVDYHKRLFMFFDRNKPYALTIKYHTPIDMVTLIPIIGTRGVFIVVTQSVKLNRNITKRYETEEEVKSEIREIDELQRQVEEIKENHRRELLNKIRATNM